MGVVYQLTFFLAVTLLAIVITIFVFAVSLLGRAVEAASREQEKTTREQKDATEREIAEMQKQVSDLMKKKRIGQELRELEKRLKQLRKQDNNFAKKLSRIGRAPELLRVKGGVLPPAISLGIAMILTGLAWYLPNTIQTFTVPIPFIIWILGLAAIGYSISCIYRSLRVVESVAITSEEAALMREKEALKMAFKELEEERKPKLELEFYGEKLPLRMKSNSEKEVEVRLSLVQGDEAVDILLYLAAPPGFDFPGEETYTQDADHPTVPNYITANIPSPNIKKGIAQPLKIKIKAPARKDKFDLCHRIVCSGFDSGEKWFSVVVK